MFGSSSEQSSLQSWLFDEAELLALQSVDGVDALADRSVDCAPIHPAADVAAPVVDKKTCRQRPQNYPHTHHRTITTTATT